MVDERKYLDNGGLLFSSIKDYLTQPLKYKMRQVFIVKNIFDLEKLIGTDEFYKLCASSFGISMALSSRKRIKIGDKVACLCGSSLEDGYIFYFCGKIASNNLISYNVILFAHELREIQPETILPQSRIA